MSMKVLVVTVAGMSSRFSKSVGRECLKCIYYENRVEESLLYQILHKKEFDKYVVVGGFQYAQLQTFVQEHCRDLLSKIQLVYNEHYEDYGSGYSLYLGLEALESVPYDEVVFAEGDLALDTESFCAIADEGTDVLTYNNEPIWADKAVVYYFDSDYRVHYLYDVNHQNLQIPEPFVGVFNSGQVWKFAQPSKLKEVLSHLDEEEKKGTNLVIIQHYFDGVEREQYRILGFRDWINCNTIEDFKRVNEEKWQ